MSHGIGGSRISPYGGGVDFVNGDGGGEA